MIARWSKLQGKVAPSSGEAELFSGNVGLSALTGTVNLMREVMGQEDYASGALNHYVDATACKSMLLRRGAGAVKHLEVRDLWGQELVKRYGITVIKIPREQNGADVLASASAPADFDRHLGLMNIEFRAA